LTELAAGMSLKLRDFTQPLFVATTGQAVSPPLFDSMEILGPDLVKARLKNGIDLLGGVSKKQAKKLEKEFKNLSQGEDNAATS
ncbi:MAG: hypothetical protein ACR2PJ_07860, partial [Pseudomonadales bacterium]